MADKTIVEKITQGRQYRTMTLNADTDGGENKNYIIKGYAATFNEPYTLYSDKDFEYREQIDPQAFANCDMSDVILQFDHEGRVFARTSNGTLQVNTDAHGLHITADLSSTETTREIYDEVEKKLITKMSFGFKVSADTETRSTDENGKEIWLRTITAISKLYDTSLVSLPANDGTEVSIRSLVDGVIAKRSAELTDKEKKEAEEKARQEAEQKAEAEKRERMRLRALALINE